MRLKVLGFCMQIASNSRNSTLTFRPYLCNDTNTKYDRHVFNGDALKVWLTST